MTDNTFVKNLAVEQRRRLVASIMECFEKKVAPTIPMGQRNQVAKEFRDKVMQSVGQYHDFVLDCLKASINDGSIVNEEALTLLRDLIQGQHKMFDVVDGLTQDVADLFEEQEAAVTLPTPVSSITART